MMQFSIKVSGRIMEKAREFCQLLTFIENPDASLKTIWPGFDSGLKPHLG